MALCVDLQAQEAMEELREAVPLAPDCFIARLKFGELLMRLRICDQAAEETQKAAQLATNDVQSDLARKQAATIRTMLQRRNRARRLCRPASKCSSASAASPGPQSTAAVLAGSK